MNQLIESELLDENGSRFRFGMNWHRFLKHLDEDRIQAAVESLKSKLNLDSLDAKTFLDVGSGSGLFSLAAHQLGATVHSFDYDQDSVNCTKYLKENYGDSTSLWSVEHGSVLDQKFMNKFGQVDILYSWGVLHHTGHMYQAFHNVSNCVKSGGKLFISIYNDQGGASKRWTWIKRKYNSSPSFIRILLTLYTLFRQWTVTFIKDFIRTGNPFKSWINYGCNNRGMSAWHDIVDWVGGYPFEVAKPEEVIDFFMNRGYCLNKLKSNAGGIGCNEFVFTKI